MILNPQVLALISATISLNFAGAQDDDKQDSPVITPYLISWLVHDTNIDRDDQRIKSWGVVYGAGLQYKSDADKPLFEASYEVAKHNYSSFDEFDRVSHAFSGIVHHKFSDQWRADLLAEVAFKGSSEDRDINDSVSIQPRFEYRITDDERLKLRMNYRWRKPPIDPNGRHQNRYAEFIYEKRLPRNHTISASIRHEINRSVFDGNHYNRTIYGVEWETEPTDKDTISIELKFKDRRYTVREVTKGVQRQDESWVIEADWEHFFDTRWSVLVDYRMERRTSNDPDEDFIQRVFGLGTKLRF
ncbi:MAG: hypothetical protein M3R13_10365 [Armatimonadota bacterium]|nr:hypothetical protein [Armatimonadota bacterium]